MKALGIGGVAPLLTVVLLDAASYAIILPVLPSVLLRFGAGAGAGGILIASHAAATMVAASLLGRLSDRLGRRPVILGSLAVALVAYVGFAFAPNLWVLFAARIVSGFAAGNLSVVQAALSDATPEDRRGQAMGLMTTAWGVGFFVGPIIAAAVPESRSAPSELPGLAAGALCVASLILVAVRRPTGATYGTTVVTAVAKPARLRLRSLLIGQFAAAALSQASVIAMAGFMAHDLYGWGAAELGVLMAVVSGAIVVTQGLIVPRLMQAFGDRSVAGFALGTAAAALVLLTFETPPAAYGVLLAIAFCGIVSAQTSISTQLSKTAGPLEQGKVMGMAGTAGAAGRVVGPALAGASYAAISPGTPFLFCGLLLAIVAAVSLPALTGRRSADLRPDAPADGNSSFRRERP